MLVLSRQRDESIMIGDDVEVTIVDVRGDKVRLGITAPKSIPVHRREIYDAIQREKAEAKNADEQQQKPTRRPPEKSAQHRAEKDSQEQPEKEPQEQRQ